MNTKASADVAHAKTGRNLEEITSTRWKSLVLKCDEKAKSERVKCFVDYKNGKKPATRKYFMTCDFETLEKYVNEGVNHLQTIIFMQSSMCHLLHVIILNHFFAFNNSTSHYANSKLWIRPMDSRLSRVAPGLFDMMDPPIPLFSIFNIFFACWCFTT